MHKLQKLLFNTRNTHHILPDSLLPPSGRAYANVLRQAWISPKYIQLANAAVVCGSRHQ